MDPVTSTPLRRKNALRPDFVNSTPELTPLRRNHNLNSSYLDSPNDDEERANRRQEVLQKRRSTITPANFSDSVIQEQYVMCSQLYAENKITLKNAWKLQIINMLEPLCVKSGSDTLQVAGTTIDICAKVYGLRVDDVHANSLKLATNLARTAASDHKDADQNDRNDESAADEQVRDKNKKKKTKNRRVNIHGPKNTIASNSQSLCGPLSKLEPTDFTTRVKETGTIENLLTNVLKGDKTNCSFVLFDKGEKVFDDHDDLVDTAFKDESNDLENLPALKSCNIQINLPFNHFRVERDYDPTQDDCQPDEGKSQTLEKVAVDEEGFPIYELDGSICQNFENNTPESDDENNIEEVVNVAPQQIAQHIERIVDFAPKTNNPLTSSEYSYNTIISTRNGKYVDQIWAGPSHWKLKFIRVRPEPRFTGEYERKIPSKKKDPEQDPINFDEEIDVDFSKKVVTRKIHPVDISKFTLPPISLTVARAASQLNNLMLKPACSEAKSAGESNNQNNDDNPSPTDDCNDDNSFHFADDDNANDDHMEEVCCENQDAVINDNLIEAPEMVPTTVVPYATRAKQMDMKKLKSAIWQHLTGPVGGRISDQRKVRSMKFSEMYKKLPDLLSQKDKHELSCPLAFVALLHLCNEQNLKLIQEPDFKNFTIDSYQA